MIQAFPSNRADYSFSIWILPGWFWGNLDLLDAHFINSLNKKVAVDFVSIPDQVFRCGIIRKGLCNLLSCPLGGGVCSDIKMNYPASVVAKDDEAIEYLKSYRWHSKEINGCSIFDMVFQEILPALRGRISLPDHIVCHGCFTYIVAEQKQFRLYSGCSPVRIFQAHLSD